jgi:hypothetical protein
MFVDDDDDDKTDNEIGPVFEDNDQTRHRIQDAMVKPDMLGMDKKRSNQFEEEELTAGMEPHKRQRRND